MNLAGPSEPPFQEEASFSIQLSLAVLLMLLTATLSINLSKNHAEIILTQLVACQHIYFTFLKITCISILCNDLQNLRQKRQKSKSSIVRKD